LCLHCSKYSVACIFTLYGAIFLKKIPRITPYLYTQVYYIFFLENYGHYLKLTGTVNEFCYTALPKLLHTLSSADTNLYLIATTFLFLRWVYVGGGVAPNILITVVIFFEVNSQDCLFAKVGAYKPLNLNLLNGLFFFHPLVLLLLLSGGLLLFLKGFYSATKKSADFFKKILN
jgi:hypothetical protein